MSDFWKNFLAPSLDDITELAKESFADLPDEVRRLTGEVSFHVADFAESSMLAELGIEDAFELTGLYDGAPLPSRSVLDTQGRPPVIFLFRRPILDEWTERGDLTLSELVTHVLVHEIGHHFGLTDGDIHAIEDDGQDKERDRD